MNNKSYDVKLKLKNIDNEWEDSYYIYLYYRPIGGIFWRKIDVTDKFVVSNLSNAYDQYFSFIDTDSTIYQEDKLRSILRNHLETINSKKVEKKRMNKKYQICLN